MNPNIPNNFEHNNNSEENVNFQDVENQNAKNYEQSKNLELSSQQRRNLAQAVYPIPQPSSSNTVTSVSDPIQQVKNMISAGYIPSAQLIQSTQDLIKNKKSEWADVWFAILLQKLIREMK